MIETPFKPGDRVVVRKQKGCKEGARGTITGVLEPRHQGSGREVQLYWVRFDELQGDPTDWLPDTGPRFVMSTVPEWSLRRSDEREAPNAPSV
jgi:hypothetical protein